MSTHGRVLGFQSGEEKATLFSHLHTRSVVQRKRLAREAIRHCAVSGEACHMTYIRVELIRHAFYAVQHLSDSLTSS